MRYQYCPKCGQGLTLNAKQDKNKPYCKSCGFVFYQNPAVGVAAILIRDKRILLGRRKGSYKGLWCIPCGYVDWDEDVYQAVKREFLEETGVIIEPFKVYTVHSNFHNPVQHTVGIWFLVKELGGEVRASDDLDQVNFYHYKDIETDQLAFLTDMLVINKLKEDNLIE